MLASTDTVGDGVELVVGEVGSVAGDGVDRRAPVVREPWDYVAVDVRHLLTGGGTVVERDGGGVGVDRGFDGGRQPVEGREDLGREVLGEVVEALVVVVRYHEGVAGCERVRVEERGRPVGLGDDTTGDLAGDDTTERAVGVVRAHGLMA